MNYFYRHCASVKKKQVFCPPFLFSLTPLLFLAQGEKRWDCTVCVNVCADDMTQKMDLRLTCVRVSPTPCCPSFRARTLLCLPLSSPPLLSLPPTRAAAGLIRFATLLKGSPVLSSFP